MTEKQISEIMYEVCDSLNVPLTHEESELISQYAKAIKQKLEAGQNETKIWKYFGDCCPECGDEAEVYTDSEEKGYFFEDDDARCVGCGLTGGVIISESHGAGISWG